MVKRLGKSSNKITQYHCHEFGQKLCPENGHGKLRPLRGDTNGRYLLFSRGMTALVKFILIMQEFPISLSSFPRNIDAAGNIVITYHKASYMNSLVKQFSPCFVQLFSFKDVCLVIY